MINKHNIDQINRLVSIFDNVGVAIDNPGRLRATMTINVPMFGKCLVSYLPDESDCCVFLGENPEIDFANDARLLVGYRLLINDSGNRQRVIRELQDAIVRNIADNFDDLQYRS